MSKTSRAVITGGAGFIGSHLCDRLVSLGWKVTILDNLSSGLRSNLEIRKGASADDGPIFVVGDCNDPQSVNSVMNGDVIFHLAANPEVRLELNDPQRCFRENIQSTFTLLEAFKNSDAHTFVFASTSTVYGEARVIPTPEDYGPMIPISLYGASKLASEALVSAYCSMFKKRAVILRLANIVGPRMRHGVVYDFVQKMRHDTKQLEILGDGTQEKSYLYVDDLIDAIILSCECSKNVINIFNVGSDDQVEVRKIAGLVAAEMGLDNIILRMTGGIDNGQGWVGDVRNMLLDANKLRALGWKPRHSSVDAVRISARYICNAHQT